jgi:hypothetical protein
MTTAWAHLVRGQVTGALAANVGGTLSAVLALLAEPWLLTSAAKGRWWGFRPNAAAAACMLSTVVVVTLIDWGVRMAAFR